MESRREKYCRLYCMMNATTAYLHVKAYPDRNFLCSRFPLRNTSGVWKMWSVHFSGMRPNKSNLPASLIVAHPCTISTMITPIHAMVQLKLMTSFLTCNSRHCRLIFSKPGVSAVPAVIFYLCHFSFSLNDLFRNSDTRPVCNVPL